MAGYRLSSLYIQSRIYREAKARSVQCVKNNEGAYRHYLCMYVTGSEKRGFYTIDGSGSFSVGDTYRSSVFLSAMRFCPARLFLGAEMHPFPSDRWRVHQRRSIDFISSFLRRTHARFSRMYERKYTSLRLYIM